MLTTVAALLFVAGTQGQTELGVTTTPDGVGPRADSLVFSGRAGRLTVTPPRLDDVDITIDGRLDDPVWASAAILKDFTQYEPVEGIPSTEQTEILVFYSPDAMYFGIRALDENPELILGRLGERDRVVFNDDWVRIMLDTFDDQRQAYVFYINPLGLQTDGLWIEGMQRRPGSPVSIDFNPDFVWESSGRVTDEGWVAEIKIPYVSLRFREVPEQAWGLNVTREVKRRRFKQAWAPITQDVSSTLAQSGRLVGLRDLRPRRLVELNPILTGVRTGRTVDGTFGHDNVDPDFGVNARVGITRNLVLDATANPDFSQVEADQNQITVNERFALFFPEKRTFFLDGAEVFRTPRNLVHTRRIQDPSGGAKLTGKVGSFSVGYIGAVDESPRTLFDGDERAVFNLFRARRDVGTGSTVGLLYTDRTMTGGSEYNRVVSADTRMLFGGRYTWTSQFAGSWTSGLAEGRGMRPLVSSSLERSGRTFGFLLKLDDVHQDFRTQSGFIPRIGDTETAASLRYTRFGAAGSVLERLSADFRFNGFFAHDEFWGGGSPFEYEVEFNPTFSFRGGRSVTVVLRDGYFRPRSEEYGEYTMLRGDGGEDPFLVPDPITHMKAIALLPRARITGQVELNGRAYYREIPLFEEAARGLELQLAPDVTVRPTNALELQVNYTFSRLWRRRDDSVFSTVHLSRLRTQYQFSRALLARFVIQYELEDKSALRHPITEQPLLHPGRDTDGSEDGSFDGQFLISFEPSPGTIFFMGYNRSMEGERTYRLSRMNPIEDGLFVKLSYLFRM